MEWIELTLSLSLSPDPSCCHHAAELFPQCKGACEQVRHTHTNTTDAKTHEDINGINAALTI